MVAQPDPQEIRKLFSAMPCSQAEHLLKVAASVSRDAAGTWADIWAEFKPYMTSGQVTFSDARKEFAPACGWADFLEKMWLLKHYLDSIQRICEGKH